MSRNYPLLLVLFCLLPIQSALAWDSVGHRLTAAVALNYLGEDKQSLLLNILREHPRFEEDFLSQMPAFVVNGDEQQKTIWLLGQAAFWPDIARGLADDEREKYNRPTWHYTDGAWVRGAAGIQGNIYIGIERFADIEGLASESIRNERLVHNVMTAIDFNTWTLGNQASTAAEKAVALCWVLHLVGDIHQPLHTGSLYSARVFADGDRGGNAIRTDYGNLHARWDRALADGGVSTNLPLILQQLAGFSQPGIQGIESDWSQWLRESRQLLQASVYSEALIEEVSAAERERRRVNPMALTDDYINQMQNIARLRIGQAGLRLAIWFDTELE